MGINFNNENDLADFQSVNQHSTEMKLCKQANHEFIRIHNALNSHHKGDKQIPNDYILRGVPSCLFYKNEMGEVEEIYIYIHAVAVSAFKKKDFFKDFFIRRLIWMGMQKLLIHLL